MSSIAIIGCGNMGGALARAFVNSKIISADDLIAIELSADLGAQIASELGCDVYTSIPDSPISDCDWILIAVKPQARKEVYAELSRVVKPEQIVISIMAGVNVDDISSELSGHKQVIRCMPNLPVQVGKGVTTFYCSEGISANTISTFQKLLESSGKAIRVNSEELIDASTSISATGVGLVYFFIEQFINSAKEYGFTEEDAATLALETFYGASEFLSNSKFSAEELRKKVTSKAGTTEAALKSFEENSLGESIQKGLRAGVERAKEISKGE